MPTYDSSLGETKFTGKALKEIDVPDESGYTQTTTKQYGEAVDETAIRNFQAMMQDSVGDDAAEVERQMKAAREAKLSGKVRLNEGPKRRIEMLIGMTRSYHTAEVEGQTYAFQTLKSKEMRQVMSEASEFDGTIQYIFEIRRQLLARSLTKVVGTDVEQFVGSNQIQARLDLVDDMDDALLNRLYDEYLKMVNSTKSRFLAKTDDDAKEIVEDLKK